MQPLLRRIVEVAELERSARDVAADLGRLPARREELAAARLAAAERQRAAEAALEERRRARRDAELELKSSEERLKRYESQLMSASSQAEYDALTSEAAQARARVGELEEAILEALEAEPELEQEVAAAGAAVAGAAEAERAGVEELDRTAERLAADGRKLEGEASQALEALPDRARVIYSRVAEVRAGEAVAAVRDGGCASCHMRVRPQNVDRLHGEEELVQCESCQRILYLP